MKNLKTILKESLKEGLKIELYNKNNDDYYIIHKNYDSFILEMNGKAVKITKTLNPLLKIFKSIESQMYIYLDFINYVDKNYNTWKSFNWLIEDMENYEIIEDIDFNRE